MNKIKLHMPEVRNRVLLLLSSKTASQIATVEGKRNRHGTVGGDKPALWGGAAARRLKACFSLRSSFNNAMSNDFLSQEEVDALLKGVGNGPPASQQSASPGFRPYNLATQERIVRGRMPTLEIINERFARLLRLGLFNFMRRSANVTAGPVKAIKFSEFVRHLTVPSNLNLVHVKPLRGTSLFVFDPVLVFLVVDSLFGGDGRFQPKTEGRDFTQTEQRIIQRLLNLVFDSYGKSWHPVYPIEFEYVRAETNTQFANVATPNEVVVTTTFEVNFGSVVGEMHICVPYSILEPIRDLLSSSVQGRRLRWTSAGLAACQNRCNPPRSRCW